MSRRLLRLCAVPVLAATFTLAGCSGSSGGDEGDADSEGSATASCDGLLQKADTAATPPGITVDAVTWYEKQSQGATTIYYGYTNGDDVQQTRDAIVDKLKSLNFEIEGEDAEENTEAEAEFNGPADGTIQVIHLCQDHLRIRVTVQ